MKQWMYTSLIIFVAVALAIFAVSAAFGLNPFVFVFNSLVYILAVVGLLMAVPFFVGYFSPWLILRGDDKVNPRQNMAGGWYWLIAPLVSVPVGYIWMTVIVPLVCKLPQTNGWAWQFIRFPQGYETNPWGWFAVVAAAYMIGYFVFWARRDFEN